MTKQRRTKGSILEIKLDIGKYSYAQDLDVDVLFFDIYLNEPLKDINILNDFEPLFFLGIYNDVITSGRWPKVGKLPIKRKYLIVPMKFIQDPLNRRKFEIYDPNTGKISQASKEECLGLECAAVWEGHHVEDRIRDHYLGVPNIWVEQLKIK